MTQKFSIYLFAGQHLVVSPSQKHIKIMSKKDFKAVMWATIPVILALLILGVFKTQFDKITSEIQDALPDSLK